MEEVLSLSSESLLLAFCYEIGAGDSNENEVVCISIKIVHI